MSYREVYQRWRSDPEGFWLGAAQSIDWIKTPTKALFDANAPFYSWFDDAEVNTCWNCVDRHIRDGRGDQTAIIYDSPVTGTKARISYSELREQVSKFAGGLKANGVERGDRVIIYMPMIPEALVSMLACARLGAIHSVVFGGFAANELALRIDDARPRCIVSASCGIEPKHVVEYKTLLDQAIQLADHKPNFCVIHQRDQARANLIAGRDHDWSEFVAGAQPADCVPVSGNHPAYILYTSGTTSRPKGVIRPTGGHLVALHWTMKNIYDVDPGDVFWAASDVGWVVGHSYICYAPLLCGNTTIIYEGKPVGTPDAGAVWRVIEEYGVRALFTAPTAFRAIKREDPGGALVSDYNLSSLKTLFLAGERADPDTIEWAETHLGVPVIDHWWQTETGWSIAANPMGIEPLPVKHGSPTVAMPGYDLRILGDDGIEVPRGTLGTIVSKLPLPPGTFPSLWNADARFLESYINEFPGYYNTGDAGIIDDDDYVYIMARTDDVINVAGHRLSTGALEEVISGHPEVAECAVVGVSDQLKGQIPLAFLCLNTGSERSHSLIVSECVARIREQIGPVASFKQAVVVDRLPKTRSGKILRGTMAKIADGVAFPNPATIDDPAIIDEVKRALISIGYPKVLQADN